MKDIYILSKQVNEKIFNLIKIKKRKVVMKSNYILKKVKKKIIKNIIKKLYQYWNIILKIKKEKKYLEIYL